MFIFRRHRCRRIICCVALLPLIVAPIGCVGKRPPMTQEQLLAVRARDDAQLLKDTENASERIVARAKTRYDADKDNATLDILIISGGGDWGAFGAGLLKGWGKVPPGAMARPKFLVWSASCATMSTCSSSGTWPRSLRRIERCS